MSDLMTHRFGVNYTPSRNWYYCWNDFEAGAIALDLDRVAEIGADHIRLMATWSDFQPNPGWVSPAHLERLVTVMNLAAERRIDVCVTLLNGFVSGAYFIPHFCRGQNLYDSPGLWNAQEVYFREVGLAVMPLPNFLGLDLGNELNCYCQAASTDIGDAWLARAMALCEECFPGKLHVNGVDHQPWFRPRTFSPRELARLQEIIALHTWPPFTGALDRGGPMDGQSIHLPAAMAALARAYAGDGARPVWVQEYGACGDWMDDADIPAWLDRSTRSAIAAGVSWLTWWDSHDIDRKLTFSPEYEYNLGLMTSDNRIKPQGRAFAAIAKEFGGKSVPASALRPVPPPPTEHENEATWQWLEKWIGENRG
jgi:hypothetical protein